MLNVGTGETRTPLRGWFSRLVTPLAVASDAPLSTADVEAPAATAAGSEGAGVLGDGASTRALPFFPEASSSTSAAPGPAPTPAPAPVPAPAPGTFTTLRWFGVTSSKDGFLFNSNPVPNPPLSLFAGQYVTFAVDTAYGHPFVLTDGNGTPLEAPDVENNGEIAGENLL